MTPLDILDTFGSTSAEIALVATYDFDPLFFERRILRKRGFQSAKRILILMDAGRYRVLLKNGLPVSGFNRRYLVVPVDKSPFVFHPKLYLLIGEQRLISIVGSTNCTNGGVSFNFELCSSFVADFAVEDRSAAIHIIKQVYGAMRSFTSAATDLGSTLEQEFFGEAERRHPWLRETDVSTASPPVELWHSHQEALWPRIKAALEHDTVKRIGILAPFFDHDLAFVKQLKKHWPFAALSIYAQQKYATLDGIRLARILSAKDRLFAVTPPAGRRLHAKAMTFETQTGTYWLTGSPNATMAAMGNGNTEVALWFKGVEGLDILMKNESLELKRLDPRTFERGDDSDLGDNNDSVEAGPALHSATLQPDNSLTLQYEVERRWTDLHVRVTNFNERHPLLSIKLPSSTSESTSLQLREDQVEQIRGAAVCEISASSAGAYTLSNRVSLVQLQELLRDRSPSDNNNNREQKISDSGEDLVAHLDSLGTVREAVEFLNHCSIRFDDGQISKRRLGGLFWTPRDPFIGDIPSHWLSEPIDNTSDRLRDAIWDFVERHQREKLEKHVRRGNLNGVSNFLDIFRTLNGVLIAYNTRKIGDSSVIPYPYVIAGIKRNLTLFMGNWSGGYAERGFADAINANLQGDRELIRQRLLEERLPQLLQAAGEAMIEARRRGLKLSIYDEWSISVRAGILQWLVERGLPPSTNAELEKAIQEYNCRSVAA